MNEMMEKFFGGPTEPVEAPSEVIEQEKEDTPDIESGAEDQPDVDVVETPEEEGQDQPDIESGAEDQPASAEVDYDAILRDKIGDDSVRSWDDLKAKLNQKPEIEFADEEAKSLYLSIQEGKLEDVRKYVELKTTDFDQMDDQEVAIRFLKEKKKWPDSKIEKYLATRFWVGQDPADEDLLDEQRKEIERGQFEFEEFVDTAREYFNSAKKDIQLPKYESPSQETPEGYMSYEDAVKKYEEESLREDEKVVKQWQDLVDSELNSYSKSKKFSIKLGDAEDGEDFQVTYEMSDKDMQELNSYLKSYQASEYDKKFVSGEGENIRVDVKSLADDVAWRLFGPKILKSAIKEAAAKSRKDVIGKEIKNIDNTPRGKAPATGDKLNFFQKRMMGVKS